MAYQEDLILSMYGRGEPGLAMADPLPPPDQDPRQPRPDPTRPADSPYLPGKAPDPSRRGLAHHTGGRHFTEPSMDELIQGIIEGEIAPGTLGDEETEQRLIEEYMQRQQQSMLINTSDGQQLAGAQDINTKMHILPSGMMVDENGIKYMWSPQGQKFLDFGEYDPYYDGLPIPMVKHNSGMKIASHDNRPFKSVPATGARGDTPASKEYIDGMLQRNIKPSTPNNLFGAT